MDEEVHTYTPAPWRLYRIRRCPPAYSRRSGRPPRTRGSPVANIDGGRIRAAGPTRRRVHPAWRMVAVAAFALIAAGSFTTIGGLVTDPLIDSREWSRTGIGAGAAINMVLYGAVAPFSAALMDKYGLRRITSIALALLVASSLLVVFLSPTVFWFVIWWGFIVGVGTGSITMVFGATVANRWFHQRIGLATGLLTAASVVGQFAMLPLLSIVLDRSDWRGPILTCGALAAAALVGVLLLLEDHPRCIGVRPYGDRAESPASTGGPLSNEFAHPFRRTIAALVVCLRDSRFWVLALMFALCGATTNGLMWSHFTPAAHDHGMQATAASGLLAIIGIANILGTVTAGWLTDRIQPGLLLAVFFLGRGISLAFLPVLFASALNPNLVAFAVAFGILDVATVPPTLALCRRYFGQGSALAFGWVNVFHQIGAGTMALIGGLIREANGSYTWVWILSAGTCVVAAILGATTSGRRRSG
ncbi:MFS transporter [Rhodococcus hoagii]|nr:MFS transporter [Prescottella equi]NKS23198.1 MFS transporter [Prescottella equi]